MILLDTHTLVWLDGGMDQLGTGARKYLDSALQDDQLAVSAISFWEIGMLVEKGRLKMDIDILQWRSDLLGGGLKEVPVTGLIGMRAAGLNDLHGDPADRLIVATALQEEAKLATADEEILRWTGPLRCLNARQ